MKSPPTSPRPPSSESLKAIYYKDTKAAKPPIPIASANSPLLPRPKDQANDQKIGLERPSPSENQLRPYPIRPKLYDDVRRDSGLAPSTTTTPRESRTTLATDLDPESSASLRNSRSLPRFPISDDSASNSSIKNKRWGTKKRRFPKDNAKPATPQIPFMGIVTEIPNGSFEDLTVPGQVDFSKRGSMLIGGMKANSANGSPYTHSRLVGSRRIPDNLNLSQTSGVPSRILSADDEMLSHKVRSMYEGGTDKASDWAAGRFFQRDRNGVPDDVAAEQVPPSLSRSTSTAAADSSGGFEHSAGRRNQFRTAAAKRESVIVLEENELAGGIEDWEDINSGDVDRYGFIVRRRLPSRQSSEHSPFPDPQRIPHMPTSLQMASEAPRRQRSTMKKNGSKTPGRSLTVTSKTKPSSKTLRPLSSQGSFQGSTTGRQSKFRSAANRLPHNKNRKIMEEAGDMLTLPPGLSNMADLDEDGKATQELKRKEWEREEKWRKMAKLVNHSRDGGGMTFEFDTKSPKVIERTWKGIPDKWRATAWHAFMTASANKWKDSPTDEDLIATFQKLVEVGSPDDVQIDIDVPRTINSHIMFRRRYRGGQRLLFRVLHCLSIYFPETGYVQGMAALAATLLCYFDEEMAFVMLVRLWQLRGLQRLYDTGFEGLMLALDEFEKNWLGKGELATKLVSPQSLFNLRR